MDLEQEFKKVNLRLDYVLKMLEAQQKQLDDTSQISLNGETYYSYGAITKIFHGLTTLTIKRYVKNEVWTPIYIGDLKRPWIAASEIQRTLREKCGF
jgi:hypothetical protein